MNQATLDRSPEEIAEIEKHKYFLSERSGYDVGWEAAEQDWESNHAEQFRQSIGSEATSSGGRVTIFKRLLAKARIL